MLPGGLMALTVLRRNMCAMTVTSGGRIPSFLVYIRRTGDVYRPVSCIRLENIRDGIIDAIYYKLAKERAEKSGDAAMRTALRKIAARPKPTIAAYEAARAELRAMLVK